MRGRFVAGASLRRRQRGGYGDANRGSDALGEDRTGPGREDARPVRPGRDLRRDRAVHHQLGRPAVRRSVGVHHLDRRLRDLPDHRRVRHRSARPDVPRGGVPLRLDPQGPRTLLGVLRRVRGMVAGPHGDGGIGGPGRQFHPADRRVLRQVDPHEELGDRHRGPRCPALQRGDVAAADAAHAELRERPVLRLRGRDLPDRPGRGGMAPEGEPFGDGLRIGLEPVQGRHARAGPSRQPDVLLLRHPRAPWHRDAPEHGRRGARRGEGHQDVPAVGLPP